MSFETIAEELIVLEPMNQPMDQQMFAPPGHSHHHHGMPEGNSDAINVMEPVTVVNEPLHIDIVIGDLEKVPGAGNSVPEVITVEEEPEEDVESSEPDSKLQASDQNDARKSKKSEKWDWESKGATGFVSWVKERLETVPRHSGMDTAGLERAISYLEKLDSEISKAMRLDLEGELDANKIEEVRSKIDDGLSRLHERLDKIKKSKKNYKKKKADDESESGGLVKEAQKITGVQGIYVTVPLLISRIARVCINGMVSAGHDIEDMYDRQVKLYKLNTREQAEVMQLLADMGYQVRQDRGFMPEDAIEVSDSDGMDWASNYKG